MPADLTDPAILSPADLGIGRLFDRVRDAVIVADAAAGRIILWNPAAENVFGYTASEAVGMSIEALVPASLKVRHRAGLANFSATGHGAIIDGSLDKITEVTDLWTFARDTSVSDPNWRLVATEDA